MRWFVNVFFVLWITAWWLIRGPFATDVLGVFLLMLLSANAAMAIFGRLGAILALALMVALVVVPMVV